jgi:hypothetical protein
VLLLAAAVVIPPRKAEATIFQTGYGAGVQVKWFGFALTAGTVSFSVKAYNIVTGATATEVKSGVLTLGSNTYYLFPLDPNWAITSVESFPSTVVINETATCNIGIARPLIGGTQNNAPAVIGIK